MRNIIIQLMEIVGKGIFSGEQLLDEVYKIYDVTALEDMPPVLLLTNTSKGNFYVGQVSMGSIDGLDIVIQNIKGKVESSNILVSYIGYGSSVKSFMTNIAGNNTEDPHRRILVIVEITPSGDHILTIHSIKVEENKIKIGDKIVDKGNVMVDEGEYSQIMEDIIPLSKN